MKVLLCSDGSAQAVLASRFVTLLAREPATEVTLLGIAENPGDKKPLLDSLRQSQEILEGQMLQITLVFEEGDPTSQIVRHTREHAYDLLVIGATSKSRHTAYAMSRKAYKIIKLAAPPVLVVIGEPKGCSRILLCSSGRANFDEAVRLTGKLARASGASVMLLHVFVEPPAIYAGLRREDEDWLWQSNSLVAKTLRHQITILENEGVPFQVKLRFGSVPDEILEEVERGAHDMLVVGSRPASGPITRYLLGNITRELINMVPCPILVTRTGVDAGLLMRLKTIVRRQ